MTDQSDRPTPTEFPNIVPPYDNAPAGHPAEVDAEFVAVPAPDMGEKERHRKARAVHSRTQARACIVEDIPFPEPWCVQVQGKDVMMVPDQGSIRASWVEAAIPVFEISEVKNWRQNILEATQRGFRAQEVEQSERFNRQTAQIQAINESLVESAARALELGSKPVYVHMTPLNEAEVEEMREAQRKNAMLEGENEHLRKVVKAVFVGLLFSALLASALLAWKVLA